MSSSSGEVGTGITGNDVYDAQGPGIGRLKSLNSRLLAYV